MRFKIKNVKLEDIDFKDETFRITTNDNTDDLFESIKDIGLLNPPLLIKNNSHYTVVCGFRRIAACQRLGLGSIDARILDALTKKYECVKYAIVDNAFQRPLNLIEKSRSIDMLSGFFDDPDNLVRELSTMGLPENQSIIQKIKKLRYLPQAIQNGILSNTLSLPMALELGNLETAAGESLTKLFDRLKLGLNRQREIITLAKEIANRDDIPLIGVLNENALQEIINNNNFDRNQKTQQIRQYLKRLRFPHITKAERSFEKHKKKLNLKKGVKLIPPEHFESTIYTLKFNFSNLDDLQKHQSTFDAIIRNPSIKKILR